MAFDVAVSATAEGNPQGEVLVAGADNALVYERIAGASVADVASGNLIGGIPVVHRIAIGDGATADFDFVLTHKERVIDVHLVKTTGAGGASDTITVKNGANAITNAMSINVADTVVVRAANINTGFHDIAAGGTLRVTRTKVSGANVACAVYVTAIRVA